MEWVPHSTHGYPLSPPSLHPPPNWVTRHCSRIYTHIIITLPKLGVRCHICIWIRIRIRTFSHWASEFGIQFQVFTQTLLQLLILIHQFQNCLRVVIKHRREIEENLCGPQEFISRDSVPDRTLSLFSQTFLHTRKLLMRILKMLSICFWRETFIMISSPPPSPFQLPAIRLLLIFLCHN